MKPHICRVEIAEANSTLPARRAGHEVAQQIGLPPAAQRQDHQAEHDVEDDAGGDQQQHGAQAGRVASFVTSSAVKPSCMPPAITTATARPDRHDPDEDVQEIIAEVAAVDVAGTAGEIEALRAEEGVGDARPREIDRDDAASGAGR